MTITPVIGSYFHPVVRGWQMRRSRSESGAANPMERFAGKKAENIAGAQGAIALRELDSQPIMRGAGGLESHGGRGQSGEERRRQR